MGENYPTVIGGKEYWQGEPIVSVDPACPRVVLGTVYGITRELADHAVRAAREAQKGWSQRSPGDRGAMFRAASVARRRRAELAAWQVREVGKSWLEADADVAEAIDYLEYYGREMIRLGKAARLGDCPGEENLYLYRPRGVGLVIAPWNFPLAISVGMASAALVTGNAVLYKPSSLSPVNGWLAFSLLREGGAPDGVLHFIPGKGDAVGDHLVGHPEVDFVLFTGSRAVGLRIVETAGRTGPDRSRSSGPSWRWGQERDPDRCGRRPGPGDSGGHVLRVRVPGTEMLRLLPGDHPRGLLRSLPGPAV